MPRGFDLSKVQTKKPSARIKAQQVPKKTPRGFDLSKVRTKTPSAKTKAQQALIKAQNKVRVKIPSMQRHQTCEGLNKNTFEKLESWKPGRGRRFSLQTWHPSFELYKASTRKAENKPSGQWCAREEGDVFLQNRDLAHFAPTVNKLSIEGPQEWGDSFSRQTTTCR